MDIYSPLNSSIQLLCLGGFLLSLVSVAGVPWGTCTYTLKQQPTVSFTSYMALSDMPKENIGTSFEDEEALEHQIQHNLLLVTLAVLCQIVALFFSFFLPPLPLIKMRFKGALRMVFIFSLLHNLFSTIALSRYNTFLQSIVSKLPQAKGLAFGAQLPLEIESLSISTGFYLCVISVIIHCLVAAFILSFCVLVNIDGKWGNSSEKHSGISLASKD